MIWPLFDIKPLGCPEWIELDPETWVAAMDGVNASEETVVALMREILDGREVWIGGRGLRMRR